MAFSAEGYVVPLKFIV